MNSVKAKLKIAMVAACPFPANHGSAASIREMSEALAKLGHEIHVVTYPISEEIPVDGVTVHRVSGRLVKPGAVRIGPTPHKLVYDVQLLFKLLEVVARHDIDVIHAHNYEAAIVGWVAKRLRRRPLVYNAVTNMRDELPTYDFVRPRKLARILGSVLDYLVPRGADVITSVSDELSEYLAAQGIVQNAIKTVPAGVNLDMFQQASGTAIRERHRLEGLPIVAYTGALERFQNVDCLLQAMQIVIKRNPDARLLLVGSVKNSVHLAHYKKMARDLHIQDRTLFVEAAPLAELPHYLAAADVAVVPRTDCPGHPVKLLNYMAAAKPIVSFRGAAKGLHHMHNGYLVDDHDCRGLALGIDFLLNHRELSQRLGERARDTIRGVFDWETLAQGIEFIYGEVSGCGASDPIPNPYLKSRYVLEYVDRRAASKPAPSKVGRRTGNDRRSQRIAIQTLERRQVAFPSVRSTRLQGDGDAEQSAGEELCAADPR
jgi:1,2-diacylglycerol 3-alpha-glucosyltransferase